jgi:hypothetical protein
MFLVDNGEIKEILSTSKIREDFSIAKRKFFASLILTIRNFKTVLANFEN